MKQASAANLQSTAASEKKKIVPKTSKDVRTRIIKKS